MSAATLTIKINVDTSKVDYVSGPGNSNFVNGRVIYTWTDPNGGISPITAGTIATFKFKAKAAGTTSFSVSGEFYDSNENVIIPSFTGTSVSIQEKTVTPPSGNVVNNNTNQSGGTASNNNQTNTAGNTGNNTGGSQVILGETSLENQTSQANQSTSGGTSSRPQTGTSSSTQTTNTKNVTNQTNNQVNNQLNSKNNSNQNNNNPSINNESNNVNVNLKELHLNVEGINPAFNTNTVRYYLVVSNLINNIEVVAVPEDTSARVEITGNTNLVMGNNEIIVKVISSDGRTSKIYTINVSKTEDKERGNASLENLAIENVWMVPEFNSNVFEYTAEIESEIDNLKILAVPQREKARSSNRGKRRFTFWR